MYLYERGGFPLVFGHCTGWLVTNGREMTIEQQQDQQEAAAAEEAEGLVLGGPQTMLLQQQQHNKSQ